jgi:hypothetical protein
MEPRLGAAHDEVVDDHGDEVQPDRVVLVQGLREPPGPHRTVRNSLPLHGSCRSVRQICTALARGVRRQCANMRGYRWAISCSFASAFRLAASRLYFLGIQRTR